MDMKQRTTSAAMIQFLEERYEDFNAEEMLEEEIASDARWDEECVFERWDEE